ncbi:hypothetical protein D9M71_621410 [compost metagenome]
MKRPACSIRRGSDAVFLGFRHVLAAKLLQPAWRLRRFFKVETTGVEDLFQRDFAHDHRDDFGLRVQSFKDRDQLLTLAAADQIDLADQDHVGEFDLLDQ